MDRRSTWLRPFLVAQEDDSNVRVVTSVKLGPGRVAFNRYYASVWPSGRAERQRRLRFLTALRAPTEARSQALGVSTGDAALSFLGAAEVDRRRTAYRLYFHRCASEAAATGERLTSVEWIVGEKNASTKTYRASPTPMPDRWLDEFMRALGTHLATSAHAQVARLAARLARDHAHEADLLRVRGGGDRHSLDVGLRRPGPRMSAIRPLVEEIATRWRALDVAHPGWSQNVERSRATRIQIGKSSTGPFVSFYATHEGPPRFWH